MRPPVRPTVAVSGRQPTTPPACQSGETAAWELTLLFRRRHRNTKKSHTDTDYPKSFASSCRHNDELSANISRWNGNRVDKKYSIRPAAQCTGDMMHDGIFSLRQKLPRRFKYSFAPFERHGIINAAYGARCKRLAHSPCSRTKSLKYLSFFYSFSFHFL